MVDNTKMSPVHEKKNWKKLLSTFHMQTFLDSQPTVAASLEKELRGFTQSF
jgi:hypothetical protein